MSKPVKVIDLFAGPGGLGEGFSAFRSDGTAPFKIAISIEKDESAHRTLTLRSFFRQFPSENAPEAYYEFLRGQLGRSPEEQLYRLPELRAELEAARREAQLLELGTSSQKQVYKKISDAVGTEDCILIGGPPCQAYSLVGRSRNQGAKGKKYSAKEDHRNFLYREYLRILARFQPLVFVMENVKGMLSAKIDGEPIFPAIMEDLKNPCKSIRVKPENGRARHKYRIFSFVTPNATSGLFELAANDWNALQPKDFIIRSERYGIPQTRHRVILLGVREDIAQSFGRFDGLQPADYVATVEQTISDLPRIRSTLSKKEDSTDRWREAVKSFPNNAQLALEKDSKVPREVYEKFHAALKSIDQSPVAHGKNFGQMRRTFSKELPQELKDWFADVNLGLHVVNHESRGHMKADLYRYLYYAVYTETEGISPTSKTLPEALWPKHQNFGTHKFADRFRVQSAGKPATTVTSHISKDGHYFIHYDQSQCRSLTVREAARLQTFPDNYFFVGERTDQYIQVGNAVPPFLAKQLASVVANILQKA
jgi:DNA (cytosine-5)-methyltransferase 1